MQGAEPGRERIGRHRSHGPSRHEDEIVSGDLDHAPTGTLQAGVDTDDAGRGDHRPAWRRRRLPATVAIALPFPGRIILETISALLGDLNYRICLAVLLLSGVVRGFAGFGTGMIAGPAVAALVSPQAAVVVVLVMDLGPATVLVPRAARQANWREVLPVTAGYFLLLPAGLALLKFGNPVMLRWFIAAVILAAVAALLSGWVYGGPRNRPVSVAVGGLSGFLGGATAVGGPPVLLYWMASRSPAFVVRANMIAMFALTQIGTLVGLIVADLLTWPFVAMALIASPGYLVALVLGTRLHDLASEPVRRAVALGLVTITAIVAAPAFDGWLRP